MGRVPTNSERLSDIRATPKLLVIASEGERAEPQYFKTLGEWSDANVVLPLVLKRSGKEKGHSDPEHVFNQLKAFIDSEQWRPEDEFWLVVDTDSWENLEEISAQCNDAGYSLAVTNPCFEFWLLLHLVDPSDLDEALKAQILENPTSENKKHTFTSQFHGKKMKEITGKTFSKSRINAPTLMPYVADAIQRAKELTGSDVIPSGLGSGVYRIVEQVQLLPPLETPNSPQ